MAAHKNTPAPSCKAEAEVPDQFPVGLRVLVVDDDVTCLRILEQMLRRCMYLVTSCSQATVALNLLRERKGCFDVVLSDVHMPDMDGFKLLELVGLEMDLPVIMMSADGRTSAVMRGISHGACDYLIKPIREEELKNLWQHVVRKKWNESKEHEHSSSLDDVERQKKGSDDAEYASSFNSEGAEQKTQKKRKEEKEEDIDTENDDPTTSKKPRVVWSVELHQQFVTAVNHLGIDKAVPKRILELMNVPGLTRENVASHLQKFRLYLKRLSGVSQHQGGLSGPYSGHVEHNAILGSLGGYNIQALAASGQVPPQTLAALHAELLGRTASTVMLAGIDQSLPGSLQGPKPVPVDHTASYGQPLIRCTSNVSKQFPQNIDVHSGLGAWTSSDTSALSSNNLGVVVDQNAKFFMGMLHHHHHQQQQQQQQKQSLSDSSHSFNVQPSCLVVPSQSSLSFQSGKDLASANQDFNFYRKSTFNCNPHPSQPSNSSFGGQLGGGASMTRSLLSGYSTPGSMMASVSSCLMSPDSCENRQLLNLTNTPSIGNIQDSCRTKVGEVLDQCPQGNLGFVGKGTSIPRRFAVEEPDLPMNNLNHVENNGKKVKQEPSMDFVENSGGQISILQKHSKKDLANALSE